MSRKAGAAPENTRKRLLQSAAKEFSKCGYQKASLRRICERAGVTTGALYFFFEDKNHLFASVMAPAMNALLEMLQRHFKAERSASRDILGDEGEDVAVVQNILRYYRRNRTVCDVVLRHQDHPAVRQFTEKLIAMLDAQTLALAQKQSQERMPDSFTVHWVSHLQKDTMLHLLTHSADDLGDQVRAMIRFLRGGKAALLALDTGR